MTEPTPARTPCLPVRIYYAIENRITAWRIARLRRRIARMQEEVEVAIQVEAIRRHVSVEQIKAEYRAELEAKGLKCPDHLM
ncbi:MAG: hypothetical protein A3K18_00145 [Lentisphaerae bacterium RIFOXYA12_64_32]|nr:MAG: hypothetical protein A3K18_00145 [Lentisphaerae bacterium RIFOXYA12_64_32]